MAAATSPYGRGEGAAAKGDSTQSDNALKRRRVMRERGDVGVVRTRNRHAHGGVRSGPRRVAIRFQNLDQIIDALPGHPRHLFLSGEARQVAGTATPLRGNLGAL